MPAGVHHARVDAFKGQAGALRNGQRVLYVTERCVLELTEGGLRLVEVYGGIDAARDILPNLEFPLV